MGDCRNRKPRNRPNGKISDGIFLKNQKNRRIPATATMQGFPICGGRMGFRRTVTVPGTALLVLAEPKKVPVSTTYDLLLFLNYVCRCFDACLGNPPIAGKPGLIGTGAGAFFVEGTGKGFSPGGSQNHSDNNRAIDRSVRYQKRSSKE